MADAGHMSDLRARTISAVVMVILVAGALWAGGYVFAVFVGFGAALIVHEWAGMVGPFKSRAASPGAAIIVAVSVAMSLAEPQTSLLITGAVAFVFILYGTIDPAMRWLGFGILYAAWPGISAVALRGGDALGVISPGFVAIIFVFVVVAATDTGAYFAGRTFGGPKLMPKVSPKKTWSGAIGGLLSAIAVGLAVGIISGKGSLLADALIAGALSIAGQAGDLGESAMKRHFGVKDSGNIIPGHGGIMDRVDGLVIALVLAAAIGYLHSDAGDPGLGLLAW